MSRKGLDKKTTQDLVRLSIFMVITAMATALLAATIGNLSFESTREYKAVFSDATGVVEGDDVRLAGVKIGTVKAVEVVSRTRAQVTFTVREETPLTEATEIRVKFRNLVGQRYLALSQDLGSTAELKEDATIPLDRTHPALDLTTLFNGFKPLFAALSPRDINKLSYEIVQVFQGEGGTVEGLLADTASLTSTLADRDEVIGDLISNLNTVLEHVADRDDELSRLIKSFRTLVGGLAKDRDALLGPLDEISALSVETAGLVQGLRPELVADLRELRRLSSTLDRNKGEVDRALQVLPIKLEKMGRTATYGSFLNFYLCEFHGRVVLPGGQVLPIDHNTGAKRCDL
jgi:phospholipid/cholesterol/gamma-HCH transport system substrate-binding protein